MTHRVRVAALRPQMVLPAAEVRHLRVRRLGVGDTVAVFDGAGGQGLAVIEDMDGPRAVLRLQDPGNGAAPAVPFAAEHPQAVTLAVALLKGDKLGDVVRAATELGVARVQLLVTEHADVRDIGASKLLRLRRVAAEAAKQSRRAVTPEVAEPLPLRGLTWAGEALLAHPGGPPLAPVLAGLRGAPLTFLSGPEGGFSEAEVAALIAQGAHTVGLGPRILRAETAPVAMLGALVALGG